MFPIIVAVVSIIVIVIFVCIISAATKNTREDRSKCNLKISAKVIDTFKEEYSTYAGGETTHYSFKGFKYSYNFNGREYVGSAQGTFRFKEFSVGNNIEILINPNDPQRSIVPSYESKDRKFRILLVFGSLIAFLVLFMIFYLLLR